MTPAASTRLRAWASGIAVALAIGMLLPNLARFAWNAYLSARFPWELDYGEGIIWQQALLMPGPRMYGDLQQFPFIVFHYPPLYHLLTDAIAAFGVPWLAAGRGVSTVACALSAVFVGLFVIEAARQDPDRVARQTAITSGVLAGMLVFAMPVLTTWGRYARIDLLACALELCGLWLGLRGLARPRLLAPAFVVFALACFTKQTVVLGAITTFIAVLVYQPRQLVRAVVPGLMLGLLLLALLEVTTGGGFLRHIVLYNVNRFNVADALARLLSMAPGKLPLDFVAVAVLSLCGLIMIRPLPPAALMATTYAVLGAAGLAALGKTGAASNYLIPSACAAALLIGLGTVALWRRATSSWVALAGLVALAGVLVVQTAILPRIGERRLVDMAMWRENETLVAMIHAADKPVLSVDMVLLMQAGKTVPWEPAIISELSAKGTFDSAKIVAMIEGHGLAFAITDVARDDVFHARFAPDVIAALERAFPVRRELAGRLLWLPPG